MKLVWICLALVGAGSVLYFTLNKIAEPPSGIEISRRPTVSNAPVREAQPSAGMCPWRAPEEDRLRWFPGSISARDETLVMGRHRIELQRRLGRPLDSDDGAIIVHRILGRSVSPGVVVTRRVRGESGLIELVLATDSNGRVLGARIQRHREPGTTANALQSKSWLAAFRGKNSASHWQLGDDIPDVAAEARPSAEAIVTEARNVLILLDIALHSDTSLPPDSQAEAHEHSNQ